MLVRTKIRRERSYYVGEAVRKENKGMLGQIISESSVIGVASSKENRNFT